MNVRKTFFTWLLGLAIALVSPPVGETRQVVATPASNDTVLDCAEISCYRSRAVGAIHDLDSEISWWTNINIAAQATLVVLGLFTAIVLALAKGTVIPWMRFVGVLATVLTLGITGAMNVFRVFDSIDKRIAIQVDVTEMINKLESDFRSVNNDVNKQQALLTTYAIEYAKKMGEKKGILGSVGRLNGKDEKKR